MTEHLTDAVKRYSVCVQVACVGLAHLMSAFCRHSLTLYKLFQHIGYLPCCDSFPVSHEDIFHFENPSNEKIPNTIRKQFETYVHHTRNQEGKTLWEASEDRKNKKANKKSFYFFTEKEKNEILSSAEIYDYLIERSTSENIKNMPKRKQLQKEIDKAKEDWQNAQREAGFLPEPYIGIMPSETDVMTEKNMIMFTALFELFFEPIDGKLLSDDIFNSSYYGGDNETLDSIQSKLRHTDLRNYCSPRKEINKTLDNILDVLADKVADRVVDKINAKRE